MTVFLLYKHTAGVKVHISRILILVSTPTQNRTEKKIRKTKTEDRCQKRDSLNCFRDNAKKGCCPKAPASG